MSATSKTFWINLLVPSIPMVIMFLAWVWTTGGTTAVAASAIDDLKARVAAIEYADQARDLAVARIERDMAWVVTRMGGNPSTKGEAP